MRRRALMAASMQSGGGGGDGTYDEFFGNIPPESTTFEFPLYITVPFVREESGLRVYEKQGDIVNQLVEWFLANADVYEDRGFTTYELYNPDVYINGEKIEYMYAEVFGGVFEYSGIILISQIFDDSNAWCYIDFSDNKIEIQAYL